MARARSGNGVRAEIGAAYTYTHKLGSRMMAGTGGTNRPAASRGTLARFPSRTVYPGRHRGDWPAAANRRLVVASRT